MHAIDVFNLTLVTILTLLEDLTRLKLIISLGANDLKERNRNPCLDFGHMQSEVRQDNKDARNPCILSKIWQHYIFLTSLFSAYVSLAANF